MVNARTLPKTAFFSGALLYSVPTFYIARSPWMGSHSVPALAGILLVLGLCYWLYDVERSSQTPKPASAVLCG